MQRWLTGIALLILVGAIGWVHSFTVMWAFFGVIYIMAFHESMKLFNIEYNLAYIWAGIIWIAAYFYEDPSDLFFLIAVLIGSLIAYKPTFNTKLIFPFLYPVSGILFFLILYKENGIESLIWLLVIVAFTDVFAYFTGKSIGKTKFSETSPNKTLEGVFGGILFATVAGSYVGTKIGLEISTLMIVVITFITSVTSIFGDLFESYLKRSAGVKDSGDILPGHGGILDRIDGYLFSAIVMVIILRSIS